MINVQKQRGLKLKKQDFETIFFPIIKDFASQLYLGIKDFKAAQFSVILEECRELQKAYRDQNKLEILDGIVDVIWSSLVFGELDCQGDDVNLSNSFRATLKFTTDKEDSSLRQYYFDSFIGGADCGGVIDFKTTGSLDSLSNMVNNVYSLGKTYYPEMDIDGALIALAAENRSKLDYPDNKIIEVFRDNKLQKKDPDGNLYPWYKPANFYEFIAT